MDGVYFDFVKDFNGNLIVSYVYILIFSLVIVLIIYKYIYLINVLILSVVRGGWSLFCEVRINGNMYI